MNPYGHVNLYYVHRVGVVAIMDFDTGNIGIIKIFLFHPS